MTSPSSGGRVPSDLSMTQLQPNDPKPQGVGDGRNLPPGHHPINTNSFVPGAQFTASPLDVKNRAECPVKGPAPIDFDSYGNFSPSASPPSLSGDNFGDNHNGGSVDSLSSDASYPGVVEGGLGFNLDALDDSMAGILDPSAASHHGGGAAAGANIAPWELEEMPSPAPPQAQPSQDSFPEPPPSFAGSSSFSDWTNVPSPENATQAQYERKQSHFPRFLRAHGNRQEDDDASSFQHYSMDSSGASLRSSSASSLLADGAQTPTNNRPRSFKGSSARNPSPPPTVPHPRHGSVATTGGHGHNEPHQSRFSRFGSVASGMSSNSSIASESSGKKKSGIFGFIKRKTGQSTSGPSFSPTDLPAGTRRVTGPSRMSMSTTASSLRKESIGSTKSTGSGWSSGTPPSMSARLPSFKSEGGISPLHEDSEPEPEPAAAAGFQLDTNFDDMDDIVDSNLAGVRPHALSSISPQTGTGPVGPQDALQTSGGTEAPGTAAAAPGVPRTVPEPSVDTGQFSGQYPLGTSPQSGGAGPETSSSGGTPPSPFNVSPKHSIPGSTAPRRPSQLRNFKISSIDSANSDVSSMGGPIAPSWAQNMTGDPTMFNDPFGARQGSVTSIHDVRAPPMSPGGMIYTSPGFEPTGMGGSFAGGAPSISPFAGLAASAAWAAPESWGVEGDEEDEDDESASSSGTEGEWAHDGDRVVTPTAEDAPGEENGDAPGTSPLKQRQPSLWPLKRGAAHAEDKGPMVS